MEICLIYNHSSLQYFQARYTDINNAQIMMKLYNIQNGSNCLSKYLRYVIYSCRFFAQGAWSLRFISSLDTTLYGTTYWKTVFYFYRPSYTHTQTYIHKRARTTSNMFLYSVYKILLHILNEFSNTFPFLSTVITTNLEVILYYLQKICFEWHKN
jgi:hypothetical protein